MPEGLLRRALRRLAADDDELVAEDLRHESAVHGATVIAACPSRAKVRVAGTVRSVTLRPTAGVPALEAELYDGSGVLYVVWLGRRRIDGIRPGAHLVAEGRIGEAGDRRVLYNPSYTLLPARG